MTAARARDKEGARRHERGISAKIIDCPQNLNPQLNMPHQLKAEEVQQEAPVVEATPSAADCEDLAKAKEACLAEGGDCSALMAGYLKCMEALKGEEA